MYHDIDLLKKSLISNDELFAEADKEFFEEVFHKPTVHHPFKNLVTVDLVNDSTARLLAMRYILKLLENKEKYGYLYFLADQARLSVPLKINLLGAEIIVENDGVVSTIEKIAKMFMCSQHKQYHAITCVELLYFFVHLVNTHLNYIQIDYMIRCIKSHQHLIALRIN